MVRRIHKKSSRQINFRTSFASSRYRSPKIYGTTTRRNQEKKFNFSPRTIKTALVLAIVFIIIYWLFFSTQFQIKEIVVEGNSLVGTDEITDLLLPGQNIFRFSIGENRQMIVEKYPEIKEVEIYRGIPDTLKIVVLERENKIVWQTNNELYFISATGFVTRKIATEQIKDLPVVTDTKNLPVTLGKELVSPNFVAFITNIYSTFQSEVNIKPLNFEVPETTFNVNLRTEAGFYIKFNSLRSSQKQLSDLKTILVEKRADIHEYIDLRVDGWAYYK